MLEMIAREVWKAEEATEERERERPATDVFYTLSDRSPCYSVDQCSRNLLALQRRFIHIKRFKDIPYNFMIGGDGRVYEGRGWTLTPELPKRLESFEPSGFHIYFMLNNLGYQVPEAMLKIRDELQKMAITNGFLMLEVVAREVWGAKRPFQEHFQERPVTDVFYTLSDSSPCYGVQQCSSTLRALQARYVLVKEYNDIPYNFMIGGDGRIYEGRGWGVAPELPEKHAYFEPCSLHLLFMLNNIGEPIPRAMLKIRDQLQLHAIMNGYMVRIPRLHKPTKQAMSKHLNRI